MARKRKHSRRRNPISEWAASRNGKISIGLGAVAVTGLSVYYYRRRIRLALEASDNGIVKGPNGDVLLDPNEPGSVGTKPKPIAKAKLPDVILKGGVPMDPPWHEIGWYTYPSGQFWIRVDQNSEALFKSEHPTFDMGLLGPSQYYNAQITGSWRWVVIAGAATPLATGQIPLGTYDLSKDTKLTTDYTKESAIAEMAKAAANQAAQWINTAYQIEA